VEREIKENPAPEFNNQLSRVFLTPLFTYVNSFREPNLMSKPKNKAKSMTVVVKAKQPNRVPTQRMTASGLPVVVKRVVRVARPVSALAPSGGAPLYTAMGAPVATSSINSRPFFRYLNRGRDSVTIHACDRMPANVVLDCIHLPLAQANTPGNSVFELELTPLNLGERLRRDASIYEEFFFQSIRAHFAPARGTQNNGSLLGFFDQDPADEFPIGSASLTQAAAHPGAQSVKIWEDGLWTAPPRMKGRFYVGNSGTSTADQRLQSQGTFRILIDVPLDSTILTDGAMNVLGSFYIEYVCHLSKPTIQPNFVGTCDHYVADKISTSNPINIAVTNANLFETYHALTSVTMTKDKRSNLGSEMIVQSAGTQLRLPPGAYAISQLMECTSSIAATSPTANMLWQATTVPNAIPSQENFIMDPSSVSTVKQCTGPSSGLSAEVFQQYSFPVTGGNASRLWYTGAFLVVPDGTLMFITPGIENASGSGTLTINSWNLWITELWPTPSQQLLIAPQAGSLLTRLAALERSLATKENKETKEEFVTITPILDRTPRPAPKMPPPPVPDIENCHVSVPRVASRK
jgi:hypothetical protein